MNISQESCGLNSKAFRSGICLMKIVQRDKMLLLLIHFTGLLINETPIFTT